MTLADSLLVGDIRTLAPTLPPASIDCCVTSPPYFAQRDYGVAGQLGLEPTPQEYIAQLVGVFEAIRPALTDTATVWVNLGDAFVTNWGLGAKRASSWWSGNSGDACGKGWGDVETTIGANSLRGKVREIGLKVKDLMLLPSRFAIAMQEAGWYLRQDIIWFKPDAMGETAKDRPHTKHEHVLLFSKSQKYHYDAEAVRQPSRDGKGQVHLGTVWTIPKNRSRTDHFATFPDVLVENCIRAGCPEGGLVLDPFFGSGTVGLVARRLSRRWVGVELNPAYAEVARLRLDGAADREDAA